MPDVEELDEYFREILTEDENLDLQSWVNGKSYELNDLYVGGWLEGVKAFWEEVENQI